MAYDNEQIARELIEIAMGNAHHGNALRVTKDIDGMTPKDRSVLDRWATGRYTAEDGWALQSIANRILSNATHH